MKRFFSATLVVILLIGLLPCNVLAVTQPEEPEFIQLGDGGYVTISIMTSPARASNTVNGSKTYNWYSSDGVLQWKAILNASYVFTGGSYTCTSANCTITIYDNNWYQISKTTNYAGNRATANLTMGQKYLGITIAKPQHTINLYCDVNGNLS